MAYSGTADLISYLGITNTIKENIGITDTQLQDALDRAEAEIDEKTKTHFASGTTTPDYTAISNERHDGQGSYNKQYFTIKYPIANLGAYASGTVGIGSGTVTVDSTTGFPSSGVVSTQGNKIAYTSKTGTLFKGCSGVSVEIPYNNKLVPFAVEISSDSPGDNPTFITLTEGTEYECEPNTGRFHIYTGWWNSYWTNASAYNNPTPPKNIPNRLRITYIYGWSSIPAPIKRLCLMIASRDLMHMIVRKATIQGLNSFSPSMIDVDAEYIESTLKLYQNPMISNT